MQLPHIQNHSCKHRPGLVTGPWTFSTDQCQSGASHVFPPWIKTLLLHGYAKRAKILPGEVTQQRQMAGTIRTQHVGTIALGTNFQRWEKEVNWNDWIPSSHAWGIKLSAWNRDKLSAEIPVWNPEERDSANLAKAGVFQMWTFQRLFVYADNTQILQEFQAFDEPESGSRCSSINPSSTTEATGITLDLPQH